MFDDTAKYLEEALQNADAEPLAILLPKLQTEVSRGFSTIRAFHACRPASLASYYQQGIRPLSRRWLVQEAFELFEGTIPLAEIEELVAKADLNLRDGLLWFLTDPDELVDRSGHYLLYGPESMNCVWEKDQRRFHESQERQRKRGIPTLFECVVPLTHLGHEEQCQLTKTLVTGYFRRRSTIPDPDGDSEDWGFSVRTAIRPEDIVGHTHPAVVSDPLRSYTKYHNPVTRCEWCV